MACCPRESPYHHWRRRCARRISSICHPSHRTLQVLLRTMGGCRQARLLFPKTEDLLCLPSTFQTLLAIHSTNDKHKTSFLTLSGSFIQQKLGSARLVLESLMRTELVVCLDSLALLFCIYKQQYLTHTNRHLRHSLQAQRHVSAV